MRELALRYRVRWLVLPLAALTLGVVLVDPLQNPEYWSDGGTAGTAALWLIFALSFAVPTTILLATVRTVGCWALAVLVTTAAAIWLPVSFAVSEGSTRGLAFIVPVLYGVPAAVLTAIVDRILRSPSWDPDPASRR